MVFYQLKANGPFALNPQAVMVYFSREVFLDKSDAEAFVDVFKRRISEPMDPRDVGYLDPEKVVIRVCEVVLAGTIETEDVGTMSVEIDLPQQEEVEVVEILASPIEDALDPEKVVPAKVLGPVNYNRKARGKRQ